LTASLARLDSMGTVTNSFLNTELTAKNTEITKDKEEIPHYLNKEAISA